MGTNPKITIAKIITIPPIHMPIQTEERHQDQSSVQLKGKSQRP